MAVYYKFMSAKDFDSISIDGQFISVANFKQRIFESKRFGRGTDFDLIVTNAQTNVEYIDESMLIPKNSSVVIRRVPGLPRRPIVTQLNEKLKYEDDQTSNLNFVGIDSSVSKDKIVHVSDFGDDLYAIPETAPLSKVEEDKKIKALVESSGFGCGGRGFFQGGVGCGGLERKTPPQGYVCHRCKVAGHFIQHCPTNGDPNYDFKKIKPPTGIPKSMLQVVPEGSYTLPNGEAVVLKLDEAAFEREVEGLRSKRSVRDVPPELFCPLCKEVMKDAVLASRCCFQSFCDKCIREYCIVSGWVCVCGARDVLADHLLPNLTVRDTINRILESGSTSSSGITNGSAVHVQEDMESRYAPPKLSSPAQSAADNKPSDALKPEEQLQNSDKENTSRVADVFDARHESLSVDEEPVSQGSALNVEEEIQQKVTAADTRKKNTKKPSPMNAPDIQMQPQHGMNGYTVPSHFNPYWQRVQPPMHGFIGPFACYDVGPTDHFGNVMPLFGSPNFMAPPLFPPPQRNLAERCAESKKLPRECDYSREVTRNVNALPIKSKLKLPTSRRSPSADHFHYSSSHSYRSERVTPSRSSRDQDAPHPSLKRKSEHHEPDHHRDHELERCHHHRSESSSSKPTPAAARSSFKRHKAGTFSRTRFLEEELATKIIGIVN